MAIGIADERVGADASTDVIDVIDEPEIGAEDTEFLQSLKKKRLTTPFTRALLLALIFVIGFSAGLFVQKSRSSSAAGALPAGLPTNFADALRNGGGSGGGNANGVSGTVKLVDGNNLYITDAQGNVVKIKTDGSTKVKVNKNGKLSDLGPSMSVTVEGSKNSDGSYSATSVSQSGNQNGGGTGGGGNGGFTSPSGGGSATQGAGAGAGSGN